MKAPSQDDYLHPSDDNFYAFPLSFQTAGDGSMGWYVYLLNDVLTFQVNVDGVEEKMSAITTVTDNIWHHIAVVRHGDERSISVDGIESAHKTLAGTITPYT